MTIGRDDFPDHLSFSQRYGYEPLPRTMRFEELSSELRMEIWNEVRSWMLRGREGQRPRYRFGPVYRRFIERVLGRLHKKSHDTITTGYGSTMDQFKNMILDAEFHTVLDFIEIVANDIDAGGLTPRIERVDIVRIMSLFDKYGAPYFLSTETPFHFSPRTSEEQGIAIRKAIDTLHENHMEGATAHLRDATQHLRRQEWGDSIADSIHAVESVARRIDPRASRNLSAALDSLERAGLLNHQALKQAFSKLYGYTSDEQGIRHALLDRGSPDVGLDEAMFMFGACASFAAYLVEKSRKGQ